MEVLSQSEIEKKYLNIIYNAFEIREKAYAPYSNYKVGAALLCQNNKIYEGCNIEIGSYSPTICAERVAIFEAVKCGERKFDAIAIVSGHDGDKEFMYSSPCGVCRQVMAEFFDKDAKIILPKLHYNGGNIELIDAKIYTLSELLPFGFELK